MRNSENCANSAASLNFGALESVGGRRDSLGTLEVHTGVVAAPCCVSVRSRRRFDTSVPTKSTRGNTPRRGRGGSGGGAASRGAARLRRHTARSKRSRRLYRARGYLSVSVLFPEQEITSGTVRFRIIEAAHRARDRRGQPALLRRQCACGDSVARRRRRAPTHARPPVTCSLPTENPARQAEVVLAVGEKEGELGMPR